MCRAVGNLLLSVSLLASSVAGALENIVETISARRDAVTQAPSAPQPAEEDHSVSTGRPGDGSFLRRENDEQRSAVAQKKAVGRVRQSARHSFMFRRSSELPSLLWAHTCSTPLPQRHVRLQI